jgi:predicted amidohydrolase
MASLTLALLQIAAAGYDQPANLAHGEAACRRAAAAGADLALFPELWNIGYAFERADDAAEGPGGDQRPAGDPGLRSDLARWRRQAVPAAGAFVTHFRDLAAELHMAIAVTYLEECAGRLRNSVTLVDRDGRDALTYAKVHTCDFCWPEKALQPGDAFPVSDLVTAAGPVRVGAMICFDREFPEAARCLALEGAELILVPNACELEANRLGQLRARAFENMAAVALANYPAPQQNGHSVVFEPMVFAHGRSRDACVVEAGEDEEIVLARLDLDALRAWRRSEVWGQGGRRPRAYGVLTREQG